MCAFDEYGLNIEPCGQESCHHYLIHIGRVKARWTGLPNMLAYGIFISLPMFVLLFPFFFINKWSWEILFYICLVYFSSGCFYGSFELYDTKTDNPI